MPHKTWDNLSQIGISTGKKWKQNQRCKVMLWETEHQKRSCGNLKIECQARAVWKPETECQDTRVETGDYSEYWIFRHTCAEPESECQDSLVENLRLHVWTVDSLVHTEPGSVIKLTGLTTSVSCLLNKNISTLSIRNVCGNPGSGRKTWDYKSGHSAEKYFKKPCLSE